MKRFRRRMSHTFQSQSSDNGLSDLAESLSIQENGDINKREHSHLGLLGRATRRLSFSTSRIMDIHSNNSSVPDASRTPRHSVSLHFRDLIRSKKKRRNSKSQLRDLRIADSRPDFTRRSSVYAGLVHAVAEFGNKRPQAQDCLRPRLLYDIVNIVRSKKTIP
ncbi:hypothetical protein AVEN_46940-1 [Araneus ventricosus]|uniref:Uncharacterized protein n=1 Tax=Araneus ventricosus TaxID=182803 RepID=A0A4Y2FMC8_ARAVE|nr:hypothetical protein AVEN_46940-1 [Araneus ventricosus]